MSVDEGWRDGTGTSLIARLSCSTYCRRKESPKRTKLWDLGDCICVVSKALVPTGELALGPSTWTGWPPFAGQILIE